MRLRKNTLIIQCHIPLKRDRIKALWKSIKKQMRRGLVILPSHVSVLVVPKNIEVKMEEES